MGKLRRLFIFAAIAGIVVVALKKLGIMGGNDDDSMDFASDSSDFGSSADGGEDDTAN